MAPLTPQGMLSGPMALVKTLSKRDAITKDPTADTIDVGEVEIKVEA